MSLSHPTRSWSFQQDDLATICGSLETQLTTPELHPANDYYGQASVLKRYAELDPSRPLKAVVEHGVHLDDIVWALDMQAPLSMIWSVSPWRAKIHRSRSNKQAIAIGFGYLYAADLVRRELGPDPDPSDRQGTLAFPVHSTHSIAARFNHHDYARQLANLPDEFQPVSLCVYWKDFLDGAHQPYVDQGLDVVSCGHMYDPDFMLRFHDLCRSFRYAVSNAMGTHLFQAVASGCRFFFLDSDRIEFDIPESDRPHCGQFNPLFQQAEAQARQLFAAPTSRITAEQQAFVDHFLGTDCQLSPSELRALVQRSERLDHYVPRWTKAETGQAVWGPPAWVRSAKRPLQRWQKLKRSVTKRLPGRRAA